MTTTMYVLQSLLKSLREYGEIWRLCRKEAISFLAVFLYDAGSIAAIAAFAVVMRMVVPVSDEGIRAVFRNAVGVAIFLLIYGALVVGIYSAAKIFVLSTIARVSQKERLHRIAAPTLKPSWRTFLWFWLLNIVLVLILSAVWILLSWIRIGMKAPILPWATLVFLIGMLGFGFSLTQKTQTQFFRHAQIGVALRNGIHDTFSIRENHALFWTGMLIGIYASITLLLSWILGFYLTTPYRFTMIQSIAQPVFAVATLAAFYLIFTVTRYALCRRALRPADASRYL